VRSIIAPFGEPIEGRAAVPSEEERLAERAEKRAAKDARRGKGQGVERIEGEVRGVEEVEGEGVRVES
jgi:hypothetical protein